MAARTTAPRLPGWRGCRPVVPRTPSWIRGGCRVVVTSPCVGHQVVVLGPVVGEDDAEPRSSPCSRHQSRTAWEIVWSSTAYRSAVRTSPRYGGRGTRRPWTRTTWRRWCRSRPVAAADADVAESPGEPSEAAEDVRPVLHVVVARPPGVAEVGAGGSRPARVAEVGALAVHALPGVAEVGACGSRPARRCRGGRAVVPAPPGVAEWALADAVAGADHGPSPEHHPEPIHALTPHTHHPATWAS